MFSQFLKKTAPKHENLRQTDRQCQYGQNHTAHYANKNAHGCLQNVYTGTTGTWNNL